MFTFLMVTMLLSLDIPRALAISIFISIEPGFISSMFANNLTSFDNRVMSEQLSRAIETSRLLDNDERTRIVGSFFRTKNT